MGFITEEEKEEHCVEQLKSMLGNSDAALTCFKLFKTHVIEEMGMTQCLVDPCVFYKELEEPVVLVAVTHVDNMALGGSAEWIKWFKEGLKKRFGITDLGGFKKDLGIWCKWKNNKNGEQHIVAAMSKLVRQIIECTEKAVGHEVKNSSFPATPGSCLETFNNGSQAPVHAEGLAGSPIFSDAD
jgi:hypothetical protein